jgi:hypothetical protein
MNFTGGALKVNETQNSYSAGALNVSDNSTHTTLTNIYNCVNTRGSGIFIQGAIDANTNSSYIDLSTIPIKCLTIYGVASDACILSVYFGPDNENFYKSQYTYQLTSAGNFGFSLNACPKYICIQSDTTLTTLQAYMDYS